MEIREIDNKQEWEDFLVRCERKTFLDSWNWGEFQQSLGNKVWRLGVFQNEELVSVALVIKHKAKRGSFLLVPHGPTIAQQWNSQFPIPNSQSNPKSQILKTLLEKLRELAKQEQVDFIRISPIWERNVENEQLFKQLGFRLRALHTHPESSWKLDIRPTEEQLMAGMRKTTRYLIKQAQKDKDLEVFQSFSKGDIETFNRMHLEVVKQQKFVPFSLEYFKKEFDAFATDNQIALFLATYRGEVIAASYGIFWSGMAFYHHAALLPEYKKVPASYLLQW